MKALALAVALLHVVGVNSQGCSSACTDGLCVGDLATSILKGVKLPVCHPADVPDFDISSYFPHKAPDGLAHILVISNIYVGCDAGRREANVFSYTSNVIHEKHRNVIFMSSLKGGSADSCKSWSETYEAQGVIALSGQTFAEMQPFTINDAETQLRDALFLPPFPHPSYVIIDHNGIIREKFVGPCCGIASYFDCSTEMALELNSTLHAKLEPLIKEVEELYGEGRDCILTDWSEWSECDCEFGSRSRSRGVLQQAIGNGSCAGPQSLPRSQSEKCTAGCQSSIDCQVGSWSTWSPYNVTCGTAESYRTREVVVSPSTDGNACPNLVEKKYTYLRACQQQCSPTLGAAMKVNVVADSSAGLRSPRGVAFTPAPGKHLGSFSQGKEFSTTGEEAWIVNGESHSVTIGKRVCPVYAPSALIPSVSNQLPRALCDR